MTESLFSVNEQDGIDPVKIRDIAASYYRCGDFYCSEAVVKAIKDAFDLQVPDSVVAMASGFPIGIGGAGCTCGAVNGGIMALGLFFGRTRPKDDNVNKAMELARELHDTFRKRHRSLCCRILTKGMILGSQKHMDQCISFTGEVAEETTRIIIREHRKSITQGK
jgi:C_GCAxxG_C_C family probable redox protein